MIALPALVRAAERQEELVASAGHPQRCRVCGCTEADACEMADGGGWWWVEPDLCSACAGSPEQE